MTTTLRKAIVFKPLDEMALITYTRCTPEGGAELAALAMESGAYEAKVITPALADAEAVFDFINLKSKAVASMNPGDVIVWDNGQRELCLSIGWVAF